ncbi:hypothetical protein [Candidatus Formimonas warabiya]|nr:hypothetical protein [Candidatus Formimonas warabiya]
MIEVPMFEMRIDTAKENKAGEKLGAATRPMVKNDKLRAGGKQHV